jgi:hypothetical protein
LTWREYPERENSSDLFFGLTHDFGVIVPDIGDDDDMRLKNLL